MELQAVYQPIVDLRDSAVIGYEALVRGHGDHGRVVAPAELFAAARADGRVAEVDDASREAALRGARDLDLAGDFTLFVNADGRTLSDSLPAATGQRLVIEVNERDLIAHPQEILGTLTRLRTRGWGIALDDVGADSRSLALMSLLYPDVIKLDLPRLLERSESEIAAVVTGVGVESERSQAQILVEGIDSEETLARARAWGATLGQGFLLGPPGPLPDTPPKAGRPLRMVDAAADPWSGTPFERVTNWKRPEVGSHELADAVARAIEQRAARSGDSALVLSALPDESLGDPRLARRYEALADHLAFVGVLANGAGFAGAQGVRHGALRADDPLRGTWAVVGLGPWYGALFVARPQEDGWAFAVSYDRETVTECASMLMARLSPLED
jgi:EAL domain-containing protein (putative c-di-GMP-specific phosphodiesterase class I)